MFTHLSHHLNKGMRREVIVYFQMFFHLFIFAQICFKTQYVGSKNRRNSSH